MTEEIISYIEKKYNVHPEHPWEKYPDNMTFKAKETDKWFALILPVSRKALGLSGSGMVLLMNVKSAEDFISMIAGTPGFLPAYHMNKTHWLSILLDGTVSKETIFDLIDESYDRVSETPTKRIYEAVKKIPRGKVATYGQVAALAGNPKMARAVGNALHKNPDPKSIPCYRVVNARGELAADFAFGGKEIQAKLLWADGVDVIDGCVDLGKYGICIPQTS